MNGGLDGKVRIGTEIDDTGFVKGMNDIEKKAKSTGNDVGKSLDKAGDKAEKLGNESKKASKGVKHLGDEMKDKQGDAKNFGDSLKNAKDSASSFYSVLKKSAFAGALSAAAGAFAGAINEAVEFDNRLSRLRTSVDETGNDMGKMNKELSQFVAVSGDADSSVEALSNLLQTDLSETGITKTVDALSGAVIRFPDTLNIESLADGLQETLATGTATGQFGELLDRLGIGAENFSAQLAGVTSEAEREQLVLQTLADAGLNDVYEKYAEANAAQIEFKESQFELKQAMSELAIATLPLVNVGLSGFADTASRLSSALQEGGISGFLDELKNVAAEAATAFAENAPKLIAAGVEMIANVAVGIVQAIPQVIQKIPVLIQAFLSNLLKNLPRILESGKKLIVGLANGIISAIPAIAAAVPKIITALIRFIVAAIPQIFAVGVQIVLALAKAILSGIPTVVSAGINLIKGLIKNMKQAIVGVATIGKNIVQGIWKGISGAANWLIGKIKGWCGSILKAVKAFFGIHSPSTVMQNEVGKMLVYGIINGVKMLSNKLVQALVSPVVAAVKKIRNIGFSKGITDSIREAKKKAEREAKSFSDVGKIITDSISGKIDENTERIKNVLQSVVDQGIEAMADGEQKEKAREAGAEIMEEYSAALDEGARLAKQYVSDKIGEITDEFQNQYDEIVSARDRLKNKLSGGDLFKIEDGEVFVEDVEKNIRVLEKFQRYIDRLKEKGAGKDVLAAIAGLDPEEGIKVAAKLLKMSDAEFDRLQEGIDEKQRLAEQIANEYYADQISGLEENFVGGVEDALSTLPQNIYSVGTESVTEWMKGMNDKLPELERTARTLAEKALKAMKDELGINSPSKKSKYYGKMTVEGFANGVTDNTPIIKKAMDNIGFFDRVKAEIPRMKAAVANTMAGMMPAYSTGGNTYTNYEGSIMLSVDKWYAADNGDPVKISENLEELRRKQSRAKGEK